MRVREGAALRRRREQRGLTQRELAFLARPCSQTTIYLLERQKMTTLTEELAARIARRLGAEMDELFEARVPQAGGDETSAPRVDGNPS